MKNILADIKTAVSVFGEVRRARKSGAEIKMQKVKQCPVILDTAGILSTVEGCTLMNGNREIFYIVQKVFNELPYEERHRLTFSPKNGVFNARVQFWQKLLRPAMSAKQYHEAMQTILRWYIHIKRRRQYEG